MITGAFTEPMTTAPQLAISGSNTVTATGMGGNGGATWTYSHIVGAGDGTDLAGNNVAGFINPTFIVDNTAPVAALDYRLNGGDFLPAVPRTVRDTDIVTIRG